LGVRFLSSAPVGIITRMDQLQTAVGYQSVFRSRLVALLLAPNVPPTQLVLVAVNAIALGDQLLLDQVHAIAHNRGLLNASANEASEDEHELNFIFSVGNPMALIRSRTTPHGWQVRFNEIRSLRPKRAARDIATTIHQPFNPHAFNYAEAITESFWSGTWRSYQLDFLFNKYPIEPYHAVIVPNVARHHEQYLTADYHQLAWNLEATLSHYQPELILAYNALGASASVNHLHYQLITSSQHLPLLHRKVARPYPIVVETFDTPETAWRAIAALQNANQPFNVIYAPSKAYIVPRRFQGSFQQPSWTTGFAWYELAGGILTVDEAAFKSLTDHQIEAVFADIAP